MNILYIGDVMAEPGQKVLAQILPKIRQEHGVDFVIAQAENSDPEGKGPGWPEIKAMQAAGADFFSGGNHSLRGKGSEDLYKDPKAPAVRPANLKDEIGKGWQIVETPTGKILVVSLLGQTVGRHIDIDNTLQTIDKILEETAKEDITARIVNIHGDFSSEKLVLGYYLDGKVSGVIGDHWHIPTADAMVLPKGTAHITDVGMCGTLHSSLGVKTEVIVERWKTGKSSQNLIEQKGPLQFNAVLLEIDTKTGLSKSVKQISQITE